MDKDFAASVINVDFSVDWVHTGLKHVHREYGSDVTKIRRTITKTGLPKHEYECNRLVSRMQISVGKMLKLKTINFMKSEFSVTFSCWIWFAFEFIRGKKKITEKVSVLWENDRVHSLRQSADDHRIIVAKLNSMRQEKEGKKNCTQSKTN